MRKLIRIIFVILLLGAFIPSNLTASVQMSLGEAASRNAEAWPFAWDSIWNMPLGADATYVPANIKPADRRGMTADEDILILEPDAPQIDILKHDAGWNRDLIRCDEAIEPTEVLFENVPIPLTFFTDPEYLGVVPNHSAGILLADGETLIQTQPFHRCADGTAVSQFTPPSDNIKTGDGIRGAHGGSGMSSLGGTLRVGELVPNGTIRHALKINLFAHLNLAYAVDDPTPGYRWPAIRADGYANDVSSSCVYQGEVAQLQMGALLALHPNFNITSLNSEPAKILAQAFQDYGAYVVDDTCWNVYAIATEWGPDGRVIDEFQTVWGFDMETSLLATCTDLENPECLWAKDMNTIYTNLHIVDNNTENEIGGPGQRRVPCAPPFEDGSGHWAIGSVCDFAQFLPIKIYLPLGTN
ncbi:MAG: hypothetical protein AAF490_15110 [Chloroflexota bacterium]